MSKNDLLLRVRVLDFGSLFNTAPIVLEELHFIEHNLRTFTGVNHAYRASLIAIQG